jgi:hypothetical protein
MASDTDRPLWDRLTMLVYGSARRNGHANFNAGELAKFFRVPPPRISEALRKAKEKGLIGQDSETKCVTVPSHIATGGDGSKYEVCGIHGARRVHRRTTKKLAKVIPLTVVVAAPLPQEATR